MGNRLGDRWSWAQQPLPQGPLPRDMSCRTKILGVTGRPSPTLYPGEVNPPSSMRCHLTTAVKPVIE